MPTLSLHRSTPAHPDASHDVNSPGGYEWWYFDAEDVSGDLQVVGIFLHGFVFHPEYLRRYSRYVRTPIRNAPPLPAEYPCAYFAVYEKGRVLGQFMTQYPTGALLSAGNELRVDLGSNRVSTGSDGIAMEMAGRPWSLANGGLGPPKTRAGQTLRASLRFRPSFEHPPLERRFLSRELSEADHHWIVASPLCDVHGRIEISGEGGPSDREITFKGKGYHDHNYGSAPIGPGLRRWVWGRVLLEGQACTFHFARPRDARLPDEVHLIESDAKEMRQTPVVRADMDWSRKTAWRLAYPASISLDDALALSSPRVVDSAPFYTRLIYEASWRGRRGSALCEVAYPHRLRWPILGRMIEMSIDRQQA